MAIKLEKTSTDQPLIPYETKIMRYLNIDASRGGAVGIPSYIAGGTAQGHNFLVMELLGNTNI